MYCMTGIGATQNKAVPQFKILFQKYRHINNITKLKNNDIFNGIQIAVHTLGHICTL
jgi:hypothetical protein